jgi:hypothetical protein
VSIAWDSVSPQFWEWPCVVVFILRSGFVVYIIACVVHVIICAGLFSVGVSLNGVGFTVSDGIKSGVKFDVGGFRVCVGIVVTANCINFNALFVKFCLELVQVAFEVGVVIHSWGLFVVCGLILCLIHSCELIWGLIHSCELGGLGRYKIRIVVRLVGGGLRGIVGGGGVGIVGVIFRGGVIVLRVIVGVSIITILRVEGIEVVAVTAGEGEATVCTGSASEGVNAVTGIGRHWELSPVSAMKTLSGQ